VNSSENGLMQYLQSKGIELSNSKRGNEKCNLLDSLYILSPEVSQGESHYLVSQLPFVTHSPKTVINKHFYRFIFDFSVVRVYINGVLQNDNQIPLIQSGNPLRQHFLLELSKLLDSYDQTGDRDDLLGKTGELFTSCVPV
jgi:hypothetical protein